MSSRFLTFLHPNTAYPTAIRGVDAHPDAAATPHASGKSNETACLYHTTLGLFALTWTRHHRLSRTLRLHLRLNHGGDASFRLQIKPFLFWTGRGSKKLGVDEAVDDGRRRSVSVFWDLTRAEYGSGPEPRSGFYIAVVVDGHMALLVGDSRRLAYARTRCAKGGRESQVLILRKENAFANKIYTTSARIGGKNREISIDCSSSEDTGLCFSVDRKRVLQIKRLKWKFRGSERVEVDDGVSIQISWDVYNWVFEDDEGHAVFMFRFEKQETEIGEEQEDEDEDEEENPKLKGNCNVGYGNFSCSQRFWGFGIDGLESMNKKKKGLLKSGRSSSSSSLSSASSSGYSSSVMEWSSMEENELMAPTDGFSLLIHAWKT